MLKPIAMGKTGRLMTGKKVAERCLQFEWKQRQHSNMLYIISRYIRSPHPRNVLGHKISD